MQGLISLVRCCSYEKKMRGRLPVGYPWVVPTFPQAHPHLAAKGELVFRKRMKNFAYYAPAPRSRSSVGSFDSASHCG